MRKGITLVELLVAMVTSLIILAAIYSFYMSSINQASRQRAKAEFQREVRLTFRLLEDDIRHAGFGFPKSSFCNGTGVCYFYVDNNCDYGNETFCKNGSDRFFVADGWEIIRDFTDNNEVDGNITDSDYEILAENKFFAAVTNYNNGEKEIQVDKVDVDSKYGADIKSKNAIIVCGRIDELVSGKVGQEGRRIEKVEGLTLKFNKQERALDYKYDCVNNCTAHCKGIVLPANVWYVRKCSDDDNFTEVLKRKCGSSTVYCLYRNERMVMPVDDFQVHVGYGYDSNGDGVVENSEWINADSLPDNAKSEYLRFFWFEIKGYYCWKKKKYKVNSTLKVEAFH